MAAFKKGSFSINLGIVQIGGEFEDDDRQCAWELYTEIITRQALRGRVDADGKESFDGELYHESLDSLYKFFQEARQIMKRYPVGRIGLSQSDHLGFLIVRLLEYVVRPFLEKWQADVRHHFGQNSDQESDKKRHAEYSNAAALEADWTEVRRFARVFASELAQTYGFFDVMKEVPDAYRQVWQDEKEELQ